MYVWGTNRAILTIDYDPIQVPVPNPESTIIAILGIGLSDLQEEQRDVNGKRKQLITAS